jgi:hypothetical protein
MHRNADLERVLRCPVPDREGGADRTLGVVAVRGRGPEHAHDRVTDELLDGAAEALELLPHVLVVRSQDRPHVLRVERLGLRGEAHEVDEEDGDHTPFLGGRLRLGQRCRAREAEARDVRVLLAAARADEHSQRLWTACRDR